jgi:hypothetical protein
MYYTVDCRSYCTPVVLYTLYSPSLAALPPYLYPYRIALHTPTNLFPTYSHYPYNYSLFLPDSSHVITPLSIPPLSNAQPLTVEYHIIIIPALRGLP